MDESGKLIGIIGDEVGAKRRGKQSQDIFDHFGFVLCLLGIKLICLIDIVLQNSLFHYVRLSTHISFFPHSFPTMFGLGRWSRLSQDTVTGFIMAGIGHRTVDGQNFLIVKPGDNNDALVSYISLLSVSFLWFCRYRYNFHLHLPLLVQHPYSSDSLFFFFVATLLTHFFSPLFLFLFLLIIALQTRKFLSSRRHSRVSLTDRTSAFC